MRWSLLSTMSKGAWTTVVTMSRRGTSDGKVEPEKEEHEADEPVVIAVTVRRRRRVL